MKIMAVDPGKNTGWALFEADKKPTKFGTCRGLTDAWCWLTEQDVPDIWVVENYRVRPASKFKSGFDHAWLEVDAIRVIGAIQYWAHRTGSKFVLQEPAIKPVSAGWLGMAYDKSKKDQHHIDATLHGYYYIVKNGLFQDA